LPPAEVEARAAERHRRELARRGIEPAPEEAWEAHAKSQRSPVLIWAISAVAFVALAVSAMAATGSLPFGLGGTATATPVQIGAGPTTAPAVTPAAPTQQAAQPKPAVTPATATPAASVPKPGVTPTTAPQPKPEQQGVPKPGAKPEVTVPPSPTTPPAPLPPSIVGKDGAEMRLVRGGAFLMGQDGDPSTAPRHKLELPDFYVDLVEVTNTRYAKFVEQSGFKPQGDWRKFFDPANFDPKFYDADRNEHPVVNVTWNDARSYCEWAGKRLPFEAEWEKAARGEDDRRWPWGNEPHPEFANVENNTEGEPDTKRVGSFPKGASPFGLQDMTGNVREWTASSLQPYPVTDPTAGTEGATSRVTRGGSWLSLPTSIELTRRLAEPVDTAAKDLGFRCAVSADQATRR
jgi:formylglycine-generating enzyme required for sulfatase activity